MFTGPLEIAFIAELDIDGIYNARTADFSIFTLADSKTKLEEKFNEAVRRYFDEPIQDFRIVINFL